MNQVTYPTNKILYTYAILSGLVGGVIIGLFALVGEPDGIKVIPAYIDAVLFIGFIGIFVGFIPETATGYLITKFKLYKNFRHFISIKLIGFMISAIYVFLFIPHSQLKIISNLKGGLPSCLLICTQRL
ncbi:hypothetical protein [Moraxella bovis]|uniref:Uncharacterized protein n=1 Tax=Moraxella bovis TaxID=476 RepID=A0AAQ2T096_MORBO|nr:hypothetical protein [Moraxella bovis]UYZ75161.1 hypothetical protein LP093_10390 [Moraxella bovis]UYZ78907.1 hypothetical protein LP115_03460 [Moraxella bovis]UYZ87390.1 hypothetical protein LP094_03475 [Moraxella bovis]UYZ92816.1 hypothetical protein LP103_03450 [Moraxella bovis]UYZ97264.1 hypothetical protein LP107_10375 [Moraxella bovis]